MKIKLRGFTTYLFLFLSVCILFLTGYGVFRFGYQGIEKLIPLLNDNFQKDNLHQNRMYVSSYLSYMTRSKIAHDALIIIEKEKNRLAQTQYELDELEMSMVSFLESMEEKQKVFEANLSAFNIEYLIEDFRAAVHVKKYKDLFSSELNRRKRLFYEGYKKKKERLLDEKQMHEKRISELSYFIEAVQQEGSQEPLYTDGLPVIKDTQKLQVKRVVFFIKQGEYKRAARALKIITDTGFDDQGLLVSLLSALEDLEERRTLLAVEDSLADLRFSYLSEDYENALGQADELNSNPFLKPLLSGLNTALYRNIEIASDIDEDLDLRKDIKGLIGMATRLEKIGEYRKAVELYRKLLLLDLPPHDREHLTSKLYIVMERAIGSELKRRDNTKAIKLLEDARRLVWEGKKDEAMQQYLLLIKECPHSDYIGKAVGEIIGLRG